MATVWSKSNIPARIIVENSQFALVDKHGLRIDWPLIATRAEAEAELRDFRRVYREMWADDASEAFGLRRMSPIEAQAEHDPCPDVCPFAPAR